MSIKDCKLVIIPTFSDLRGDLSVIEDTIIPFKIKRIFYLYNQPNNSKRGGHAHKECEQFIITLSGSFIVNIDDGLEKQQYELHSPNIGLYINPMVWVDVFNLHTHDVCLALTSDYFNESDYIRNYSDFLKTVGVK